MHPLDCDCELCNSPNYKRNTPADMVIEMAERFGMIVTRSKNGEFIIKTGKFYVNPYEA